MAQNLTIQIKIGLPTHSSIGHDDWWVGTHGWADLRVTGLVRNLSHVTIIMLKKHFYRFSSNI